MLDPRLARTAAVIDQDTVGQLYVSVNGEMLADHAWGTSLSGAPMTPETLVRWGSAVKPVTAVAAARLWERGAFDLDDRVIEHLPEFGAAGKDQVTIRHLLTHTAHLGGYLGPLRISSWDDTVAAICAAPRERPQLALQRDDRPSEPPPPLGTTPLYNPAGTWILAEICRRIDGRPHDAFVREEVFELVGMSDSWNGMPEERFHSYDDRIGGPPDERFPDPSPRGAAHPQPAGGGVGPSRDLGRFYEMLLNRGQLSSDDSLLVPQTVEAMVARHTVDGMHWGLGFNLNRPDAPVPDDLAGEFSNYGRHASARAFGHNGATGMRAFADPTHRLVLCAISAARDRLCEALYEDLDLVAPTGTST